MGFDLHIGVLAFPFGTHAAPLLSLVRRLADALPRARFSFFSSAASNGVVGVHRQTFPNIRGYDVWDGTPEGFAGSHFEAVGLFLKASPGNFEQVVREAEIEVGLPVSCLITDSFLWFCGELSERLHVPWVSFWTAASCSLSAHAYTDRLVQAKGLLPGEKISFIPGLENIRVSDVPPEVFLEENPTPLAVTLNRMFENLPKCTALVVNSFEEIDPRITADLQAKFQHFLNIGPSLLASPATAAASGDKSGCLDWLDKQTTPQSVVYVSFGTVIVPPLNELLALADALEDFGAPFLWSLKPEAQKSLPEGFLERTSGTGKIVPWAPQPQVLAHKSVGVFITHGGWNSILESICSGVPLICRPFFGDQKLNGRMVHESWKIGVKVEDGVFTKSSTTEALVLLMKSEAGEQMRENVGSLKEKAVKAMAPEGSSIKNFQQLLKIVGKQ